MLSLITGQALPVGQRNHSGLKTVTGRPARRYEAVVTTNTMEELHGKTVKNALILTTDLLKSSVDTADLVNMRLSGEVFPFMNNQN